MKKRTILLLSVSLAVIFFVGCGFFQTSESNHKGAEEDSKKGMQIAIVSSPSGVDDGNFNQNIYECILNFIKRSPNTTVTSVKEENGDVAAAVGVVSDIVADYDVIVCCGLQFQGIGSIAQENPEIDFILVDAYPVDAQGNEMEVENVYAMKFKEQESGFCVGIAAALETKTGKVAVVNGVAFPSNVNYQYGFESGVNYANKVYGTGAEVVELASYAGTDITGENVGGNYVGNFNDEAQGKVIGEALIREGVDIIFVAAGASGNGVLTAVKEAENVSYIGCDVDQYEDGVSGGRNVMLTSALKIMDRNVELQLNNIEKGNFTGKNALLGADTHSTGYVSEEGRHGMQPETITKIEEAFAKVRTGELVPAGSNNGMTPDDFTGL